MLAPAFGPRTHLRQARKEGERKDEDPPAWALLDKCCDMGPLVDMNNGKTAWFKPPAMRVASSTRPAMAENRTSRHRRNCSFHLRSSQTSILPPRLSKRKYLGPSFVCKHFNPEGATACQQYPLRVGASVWTEHVSLALEVALSIKAGTVWVNGHNMFDAASGFGGYRESGFGRDGGREGLFEYVKPAWQKRVYPKYSADSPGIAGFGKYIQARPTLPKQAPSNAPGTPAKKKDNSSNGGDIPSIDRTVKQFYGGKQKRPDATYVRPVLNPVNGNYIGQVSEGNRKDVRNAVECAFKAAPGWGKRAAHNRAQIVYYIAENLELRFDEIADRIAQQTGRTLESAKAEVSTSIRRLFYWPHMQISTEEKSKKHLSMAQQ